MPRVTGSGTTQSYNIVDTTNLTLGGEGGTFTLERYNGEAFVTVFEGAAPATYTTAVNKTLDLGPCRVRGNYTGATNLYFDFGKAKSFSS